MGLSDIVDDALVEDRAGFAVLENILNRQNNALDGFTLFGVKEVVMMNLHLQFINAKFLYLLSRLTLQKSVPRKPRILRRSGRNLR
jgi:hypothetical protein